MDTRQFWQNLPQRPGVYCMLDDNKQVIYVGKAKNLKNRVHSYFVHTARDAKTTQLVQSISNINITITRNDMEAYLLEQQLIKQYKPRYNVVFRDNKTYPYILVTKEKFPQITIYRGHCDKKLGTFFGPFPHVKAARATINLIFATFKLRSCDKNTFAHRTRPCLQYQINRCSAPCVGYTSAAHYAQDLAYAEQFLTGKRDVISDLSQQMQEFATQQEYERAAVLRDQIKLLRAASITQGVIFKKPINIDAIGVVRYQNYLGIYVLTVRQGRIFAGYPHCLEYTGTQSLDDLITNFILQYYSTTSGPALVTLFIKPRTANIVTQCLHKLAIRINVITARHGYKRKLAALADLNARFAVKNFIHTQEADFTQPLAQLQKTLNLPALNFIEGFDISHMQGSNTVASCVQLGKNGFNKRAFRCYNIGDAHGDDGKALMKAVTRHYQKYQENSWVWPAVILIDGGKLQLAAVQTALQKFANFPVKVLGIVKGPRRNPAYDRILTLAGCLTVGDLSLRLLQQIRDAAHSLAITRHRRLQRKLKFLPTFAGKRWQRLLAHFGGWSELLAAGAEDLAKVSGIGDILAKRIYKILHDNSEAF